MNLNRREFVQLISSANAGVYAMDFDKLLWIPGEKKIFLPPPRQLIYATGATMDTTLEILKNLLLPDKFLYETVVTKDLIQLYYGFTHHGK